MYSRLRAAIVALMLAAVTVFGAGAPVQAQVVEVQNTPRVTAAGVTYGVWAYRNSALGWVCANVYKNDGTGWQPNGQTPDICKSDEQWLAEMAAAGSDVAYVTATIVPVVNTALHRLVGVSGAPPATGALPADRLNTALAGSFVFKVAPDGTVTFGAR